MVYAIQKGKLDNNLFLPPLLFLQVQSPLTYHNIKLLFLVLFFFLSLSFLALKAYIRTSITCYMNYFDLIYLCVIADTAALAGTTTLTGKFQLL